MTELEKRLWICLLELVGQVDEDCPQEYRTKHLVNALEDARELLAEMQVKASRLPT